jgi:hypothetical protein
MSLKPFVSPPIPIRSLASDSNVTNLPVELIDGAKLLLVVAWAPVELTDTRTVLIKAGSSKIPIDAKAAYLPVELIEGAELFPPFASAPPESTDTRDVILVGGAGPPPPPAPLFPSMSLPPPPPQAIKINPGTIILINKEYPFFTKDLFIISNKQ